MAHLTRQDILWIIVIPMLIIAAIVGPAYVAHRQSEVELRLSCENAVANVSQLKALHSIAKELGIPIRFPIPEVPASCVAFLR